MFTLNAFSTEIINEYKELNLKIVIEEIENQTEYRVTFYDDNSKIVNQLDNVFSSTGVWVEKLDDNHIAIYGGSFYAPDCFCYVLNVKNNKISEKIYLPVCFDIKNELVLSLYYEEIVIFNIYDRNPLYKIPEPNDICSYVQLWDRINRKETKLENGILYLSYKVFKDKYPTPKQNIIFYIISLICYIASCIIGFFTINEIRVFVLYAAIIALPCFVLMFINDLKNKNKSSILIIIVIILQAIGLYFQITKTGYFKFVGEFNHDGIYHIGLLITVILLYFVCIIDMKHENYKN